MLVIFSATFAHVFVDLTANILPVNQHERKKNDADVSFCFFAGLRVVVAIQLNCIRVKAKRRCRSGNNRHDGFQV